MTELKQVEEQKREIIYKAISELGCSIDNAKKLFANMEDECIVEITAPLNEEVPLQWITIQSTHTGHYSGKSYKPGNIILNIRKSVSSSLALAATSVASISAISISEPLIGIFTIIGTILSAAQLTKTELNGNSSILMAALWEDRGGYNLTVGIESGLELMNRKMSVYGKEPVSKGQYQELLDELQDFGVIRLEDGKIILKEKIHILY